MNSASLCSLAGRSSVPSRHRLFKNSSSVLTLTGENGSYTLTSRRILYPLYLNMHWAGSARSGSPHSPLHLIFRYFLSLYHCKITLYSRFNYRIAVLSGYLGALLLLHLLGHVGAHLPRHVVALLPGNLRATYVCFRLVCSTTPLL
jgi:hypothetical protein